MRDLEQFKNLVGEELSIIELSNKLMDLDCEDICEFGNWKDLLDEGNIVVATDDEGEEHIQIFFDVTILADENEEKIESSVIKITSINEF